MASVKNYYLYGTLVEELKLKLNPYTYEIIDLLLTGEADSITFKIKDVYLEKDIIVENELTIGGYFLDNYITWPELMQVNYVGKWSPEVTISLTSWEDDDSDDDEIYLLMDINTTMTKNGYTIYSAIYDIGCLEVMAYVIMELIHESYLIVDDEDNEIIFVETK